MKKLLDGYKNFRKKYADNDASIMQALSENGQSPQAMVISCCDSRVDPATIMQCDPGDIFVVRNIASIVPPYQKDGPYHSTSAALEFGIGVLKIKKLILIGHSQCAGIASLVSKEQKDTQFIKKWVSVVGDKDASSYSVDDYVKKSLNMSYENCLSFPWIKENLDNGDLSISRWFFEIKTGKIFAYSDVDSKYLPI